MCAFFRTYVKKLAFTIPRRVQLLSVLKVILLILPPTGWLFSILAYRRHGPYEYFYDFERKEQAHFVPNSAAAFVTETPNQTSTTSSRRPFFVLHIGPAKTGTTALDAAFKLVLNELLTDNIVYLGKRKVPNIRSIYENPEGQPIFEVTEEFRRLLDEYRASHRNVLLLDELLAQFNPQQLAKAINDLWNVKVFIAYRRLHHLLPSRYNQRCRFDRSAIFPVPHTLWPDKGGTRIPTISEYYKMQYDSKSVHPAILAHTLYSPYFRDILIFNIHNSGDIINDFACKIIPAANNTCKVLKSGDVNLNTNNPSRFLDYDRLAVHAYNHGLLDKNMDRQTAVCLIRSFHEKTNNSKVYNLPLTCMDMSMKLDILDKSMKDEAFFYGDTMSDAQKRVLRQQFLSEMNTTKYCNVDVNQTLRNPAWITFFRQLEPNKTGLDC